MERIMKHVMTTAEWYVMEVLWEESPLTARRIAETLKERINWSQSTN